MEIISVKLLLSFMDKNKKKFEIEFPKLIHKLILSTINRDAIVNFPSGSEVETKGYDGYVEGVTHKNNLVPIGTSIWEVGTTKKYKKKLMKISIKEIMILELLGNQK